MGPAGHEGSWTWSPSSPELEGLCHGLSPVVSTCVPWPGTPQNPGGSQSWRCLGTVLCDPLRIGYLSEGCLAPCVLAAASEDPRRTAGVRPLRVGLA